MHKFAFDPCQECYEGTLMDRQACKACDGRGYIKGAEIKEPEVVGAKVYNLPEGKRLAREGQKRSGESVPSHVQVFVDRSLNKAISNADLYVTADNAYQYLTEAEYEELKSLTDGQLPSSASTSEEGPLRYPVHCPRSSTLTITGPPWVDLCP